MAGDDTASGSGVPMFCAEQINVPPALPDLLKQFTKAAIRAQPDDILTWARDYFDALAKGSTPSASYKAPLQPTEQELNESKLRKLRQELSSGPAQVSQSELVATCKKLELPSVPVNDALRLGDFGSQVDWAKFVFLLSSAVKPGLEKSLSVVAAVFSDDDSARIPVDTFSAAYTFLTGLDPEFSEEERAATLHKIRAAGEKDGLVGAEVL